MLHPIRKRFVRRGIDEEVLRDKELAEEMVKYILENNETRQAEKVIKYIKERAEEFKGELERRLKDRGLDLQIPREEEIREIKKEMAELEISEDAELFLDYIGQEIYCQYSLKKDFSRCHGCHYSNYLCADLYSISNRSEQSLFRYSKALAWFTCEEEVTLEHIMAIMPYALWHRSAVSDEKLGEVRELEKDSSDELYAIHDLLNAVKRRWTEHREYQVEAYLTLKEENYERIKEIAEKIGHPFFKSLVK
jgi:hypothetical protein